MTIFRELLAIKSFRENQAEMAMRKQRLALAAAAEARDGASQQLEDYREFAQRQEQEMYADLCRRLVNLREIEHVQGSVVLLRSQEREHVAVLDKAQAQCESEERVLDERKAEHQHASRMKEKFVQLAQVHAEQELRELEHKEDLEIEEAGEVRRDREDWDNPQGATT